MHVHDTNFVEAPQFKTLREKRSLKIPMMILRTKAQRDLLKGQSTKSFDFSDVHKVVLNICPFAVDRILLKQSWRRQIDFPDAWGRTPPHWAVRRSDAPAAEAMVRAGVNIDAQDHVKWAPIHHATWAPTPACLLLLLKLDTKALQSSWKA